MKSDAYLTPDVGPGAAGNVIAALCSFLLPGLGQLIQGRVFAALLHFILFGVLWMVMLGWVMHIWSALSAAWYQPRR
jgi:TM2 domain-containing membrane protein YozV